MNQLKPLTFIVGMTLAAEAALGQAPVQVPAPSPTPAPTTGEAPAAPAAPAASTAPVDTLPDIVVTEGENKPGNYNSKTLSVPKMTAPLLDTPQTATVVPKEVMQDQGVTSLREALDNVTGISLTAGEGGAQGDNLTIRGFPARSDLFLDGMRDFGNYFRDPFNIEEIEVLKGPSSLTFGRGSTGGIVNQATKKAGTEEFTSGSLVGGSDLTRRATLDANTKVGERAAFRLNVMGHENKVAERDVAQFRRFGLAPSFTYGLGTSTRFTLNYMHQSENNIPDYGIPTLFSRPAPVDRKNYYGFRDTNYHNTDVDVATLTAEHVTANDVIVRNQFRYANYDRNFQITAPRIAGSVAVGTPIDSIQVNRSQVAIASTETLIDNDLSVTVDLGPSDLRHTVVAGIEASRETSEPTRRNFAGVPSTSLPNPDPGQPFSGTGSIASRTKSALTTVAGYLLDTFKIGSSWELVGGFRWDYVDANYEQTTSTTTTKFDRVDNMPSWRAGVVYKPQENGSIYASYGTSFNPSAENLSLSAANANLEPEKNQSYEIGTKWDVAGGDLSLTAAVFRTEKTNARTPDPNDPTLNVLSGEHRVDGFEVGATGQLSPRWKIFSGYSYLDGKLVKSSRAAEEGARLQNTPKHTVSVWATHDTTERLQFGLGALYVSERTASTTPDAATGLIREAEGYTRIDAMAKYRVSQDFSVQLNVLNAANTEYIESLYPAHVIPGAGRTVLLTGLINF